MAFTEEQIRKMVAAYDPNAPPDIRMTEEEAAAFEEGIRTEQIILPSDLQITEVGAGTGGGAEELEYEPRVAEQGPETTLSGMAGGLTRGLGPYAAAAAAGGGLGALGGPMTPITVPGGAAAGMGAMFLTKTLGPWIVSLTNKLFGTDIEDPNEAQELLADKLNIERPDSAIEKGFQRVGETVGAGGGMMGMAKALEGVGGPVTQSVMRSLRDQPQTQVESAIGAGIAGQAAEEKLKGASEGMRQWGTMGAEALGGMSTAAGRGIGRAALASRGKAYKAVAEPENVRLTRQHIGEEIKSPDGTVVGWKGEELPTSETLGARTYTARQAQTWGERIPFTGEGGRLARMQDARVAATKRTLEDFGVGDSFDAISKEVLDDFVQKHSSKLDKYSNMKGEVIAKLSRPTGDPLEVAAYRELAASPETPQKLRSILEKYADLGERKAQIDTLERQISTTESLLGKYSERELAAKRPFARESSMLMEKAIAGQGIPGVATVEQAKGFLASARPQVKRLTSEVRSIEAELAKKMPKEHAESILSAKPPTPKPVPVKRAMRAIDEQIAQLEEVGDRPSQLAAGVLKDWKENIQGKRLIALEKLRKNVGERFKAPEMTEAVGVGQGALNKIYGPLNEDIGAFIKANGAHGDYNKWKVGNRRLHEMITSLEEKPTLKRVLDEASSTPELIQSVISSTKASDIEALRNQLTPRGKTRLQSALLAKAAEPARKFVSGEETISPSRFASELDKAEMRGSIEAAFKNKADRTRLNGLKKALKATARAERATENPTTGSQIFQIAAFRTAGFLLMPIGYAIRAYESPVVRDILYKLGKVQTGTKEEAALFKRLAVASTAHHKKERETQQ